MTEDRMAEELMKFARFTRKLVEFLPFFTVQEFFTGEERIYYQWQHWEDRRILK